MEPANIRFGGGATETILHPAVAVWLLIAIVLIFILPREKIIAPFLVTCFTVPFGQVVVVGSLHFTVLRILILAGLARRATFQSTARGKYVGGFNAIDRYLVLWTVSELTILSLQWMEMQSLIHNLGDCLDALGGYLVLRSLIFDGDSLRRAIKALAIICVIQGVCMVNEQISHLNIFGVLGGISLAVGVRDGHIRSGGTMGSLYGGVFAGVMLPLFLWLWTDKPSRKMAFAGIAGTSAMVFTTFTSTSYLAYAAGLLGISLWPLRKRTRLMRWAFALTLVALHLVMHGPVWSLIARVDLTGSSSSYHRFALVDNCIRHFSDWWLLGYKYYNDWGWDMWDTCNQFVYIGLTGGLLTLVFYVAMISRGFGAVGKARKLVEGDRAKEWLFWCLGSSLFAHVVSSFGTNYLAPLLMALFPLLACISVAGFEVKQVAIRQVRQPSYPQADFPLAAAEIARS